jgi:(p)ppGpp synthase/HD superfamily hydrolase
MASPTARNGVVTGGHRLLHDTGEDAPATRDGIEQRSGKEVVVFGGARRVVTACSPQRHASTR